MWSWDFDSYEMVTEGIYRIESEIQPRQTLTNRCIVLDIDETLVHTFENVSDLYQLRLFDNPKYLPIRQRLYVMSLPQTGNICWGITRPHAKEFLRFCFSYFRTIIVWSAGIRPYVEGVCKILFRDLPAPNLILAREDCEFNPAIQSLSKPLDRLYYTHATVCTAKNTLILDDRPEVVGNNPHNAVVIPPYRPATTIDDLMRDDDRLTQFQNWLLQPRIILAADVRDVDKSDIFPLDITDELYD